MELTLKEIMSISGQPGLFKFVSHGRIGAIVESLSDGKRMSLSTTAKVSALADIAIFSDEGEVPLADVLKKIRDKEQGGPAIDPKNAKSDSLRAYFAEVLPSYDRNMVYDSHICKVLAWYNQLQHKQMLDVLDASDSDEANKDEEQQ